MVGNPVQAEVLSGGWGGAPSSGGKWQERFADRKGVHPGSFSVTTRLLDKEGSHQVRKEEAFLWEMLTAGLFAERASWFSWLQRK